MTPQYEQSFNLDQLSSVVKYIQPPNPIISKQISQQQQGSLILKDPYEYISNKSIKFMVTPLASDEDSFEILENGSSLDEYYLTSVQIYRRFHNSEVNIRKKITYFSSVFSKSLQMPRLDGMGSNLRFIFESNFQSGNLFAVYQVDQAEFDLVLQNDFNTSGYTQWFNFKVRNNGSKRAVQFNIVNLYKAHSLYCQGMKIWTNSKNRGWKHSCSNISYSQNQINCEGRRSRLYSTLSFSYSFVEEQQEVQFAHSFPYTYQDLQERLQSLKTSLKVRVKTIGFTSMRRSIPLVTFSLPDESVKKKAIILMARQHAGETQGSHMIDEIMQELTRGSTENQFLLWQYDIYCFPMVNVDGVCLGNYRTNANGYDLNRCWDSNDERRVPEVCHIKNQIKKIIKKQQIELILDLHGHSRKMNSFFYGNSFGKNYMLFPYIASWKFPAIDFKNCSFTHEKTDKTKTARFLLGYWTKDVGNVYTYQVSFYGTSQNGKKQAFILNDFKKLGRNLLQSMYKMFLESYKEEKNLKESPFLKEIRKEIKQIESDVMKADDGSDIEAERTTVKEIKIKEQESQEQKEQDSTKLQPKNAQLKKQLQSRGTQTMEKYLPLDQREQRVIIEPKIESNSLQLNRQRERLIRINKQSIRNRTRPNMSESSKMSSLHFSRKIQLMGKLRVHGETVIEVEPKYSRNMPANCISQSVQTDTSQYKSRKPLAYERSVQGMLSMVYDYSKEGMMSTSDLESSYRLFDEVPTSYSPSKLVRLKRRGIPIRKNKFTEGLLREVSKPKTVVKEFQSGIFGKKNLSNVDLKINMETTLPKLC